MRVQQSGKPEEQEVSAESGEHYSMRLTPSFTSQRAQDLLLVSFTDVSGLKATEASRLQLQLVIDSLSELVAVLGPDGRIRLVNQAWSDAAQRRGAALARVGVGANYLEACRTAPEVNRGLEAVLLGSQEQFSAEYPCKDGEREPWFRMHASRMRDGSGVVVSHLELPGRRGGGP